MMLRMIIFVLLLVVSKDVLPNDLGKPEGSLIALGADVAEVAKVFGIISEVKRSDDVLIAPGLYFKGSYYINLDGNGVFIQFDDEMKVKFVKYSHPFSGKIVGIGIGDEKMVIRQKLGKSMKKMSNDNGDDGESFVYYSDDVTTLVFNTSVSGVVTSILIQY